MPPPFVKEWLPSRGRECNRTGKYKRFCEGPRRAPAPFGKADGLARSLGLGTRMTMHHLLLRAPKPEWIAAAGGKPDAVSGKHQLRLLWPVPDRRAWRSFGWDERGGKRRWHKGVDIGAPEGTPVYAAQGGLVAYADNGVSGYGNLLTVVHADGTVAMYAHCQTIYVFPGQRIQRGQRVADVGHTGIARGSHLHFEYRKRGRPVDPTKHFDSVP
ncbi:MAG: M23 family metallopeptidase [Myxococcales bacterium]|nr:M23 family metallopeptidase [Myxococcales bacterium]